jgi:catechol 2,3-dioxygenase-like lactoylglutathione lyase family enzyme
MSIKLNHTIVPAKDKEAAAKFFAKIFGLNYDGPMGHFAPVRVNDELTLDFDNAEAFEARITMPFTSAMTNSRRSSSACRRLASRGGAIPGIRRTGN